MGTVFKAHDPILDRTVALKVISGDVEVTDELRARFFREAQACARLSHPNIVTVYDMGEEAGRLFIVMEFLEGEELRHLIAQRRPCPSKTSSPLMAQVCDGLHYAHQKGIVHRDIKPGNIFLLNNGPVKILDFGIAQHGHRRAPASPAPASSWARSATSSPEQARGRADAPLRHLLRRRRLLRAPRPTGPPFPGDDPIHILEQLRSEDPPPPAEVDPAIPPELSSAIQRALQKDPEQRFSSFAELRAVLDTVRRRLEDESARLAARLREQMQEVERLRQVVADRVGLEPEEPLAPVEDDTPSALDARCRALASEAERLEALARRGELLEPAYREALERLERGDAEGAAADLERLTEAMPEHARAAAALDRARQLAEDRRRERSRVRALLANAELAFERGAYAECFAQLDALARQPEAAGARERIDVLREAAGAALAAEEAARREAQRQALERARRARAAAVEAREQAQRLDSPALAASLWSVAEAQLADAEAAMAREAHAQAGKRLEEAGDLYRRAADAARREALRRTREKTQSAQVEADQARRRAQEARAEELAVEIWSAAEAAWTAAAGELERESYALAVADLDRAAELYRSAVEAAWREARRRMQDRARRARTDMDRARQGAHEAGAADLSRTAWGAGETRRTEGDAHLEAERWEPAASDFEQAAGLYHGAAERARQEARRSARDRFQQASDAAQAARRDAEQAEAPALAGALWSAAESARTARGHGVADEARPEGVAEAAQSLEDLAGLYRQAAEAARQAAWRRDEDRARAAQTAAEDGRARAQTAGAAELAAEAWQVAEARWTEAQASLERQDPIRAARQLAEARDLYGRAEEVARQEATRRARSEVQRARQQVEIEREEAERAGASGLAAETWTAAEAARAEARGNEAQGRHELAARAFAGAAELYHRAMETARSEALRRARGQAQEAHDRVGEARGMAARADAPGLAPELWAAAEGKLAAGASALSRQMFALAERQLGEALDLYRRATETARDEARETARAASGRARERADLARAEAVGLRAAALAPEAWATAEERRDSGQRAHDEQAYDTAAARLDEAAELYEVATEVARREEMRRDREGLARLQEEVRQARGRALEAGGPALASADWVVAETRFDAGQAAAAAGALVEGTGCFHQARELYDKAETAARQARLEAERRARRGSHHRPGSRGCVTPRSDAPASGLRALTARTCALAASADAAGTRRGRCRACSRVVSARLAAIRARRRPLWPHGRALGAERSAGVPRGSRQDGPHAARGLVGAGRCHPLPPRVRAGDRSSRAPRGSPRSEESQGRGGPPALAASAMDRLGGGRPAACCGRRMVAVLAAVRAARLPGDGGQRFAPAGRSSAGGRPACGGRAARSRAIPGGSRRRAGRRGGFRCAAFRGSGSQLPEGGGSATRRPPRPRPRPERCGPGRRSPKPATLPWAPTHRGWPRNDGPRRTLERRGNAALEARDHASARAAFDEATPHISKRPSWPARRTRRTRDGGRRRPAEPGGSRGRAPGRGEGPGPAPRAGEMGGGRRARRAGRAGPEAPGIRVGRVRLRRGRARFRDATALATKKAEEEQGRRDAERREQEARRGLAERAREAVASAREAAERAGAEQLAGKALDAARRRAQEAEAAFSVRTSSEPSSCSARPRASSGARPRRPRSNWPL